MTSPGASLSLNARLFASYLLLLIITLGVIAGVLVFAFSTRPEPEANIYQRLAAVLRELDIDSLALEYFRLNPTVDRVTPQELYRDFAQRRGLRILIANPTTSRVLFDSAGRYTQNDRVTLQLAAYSPPSMVAGTIRAEVEPIFGRIGEGDSEWLFAGVISRSAGLNAWAVMVADVGQAQRSLQSALTDFGAALGVPIFQAGIIGLGVAFVLAAVISRTIARPLSGFAETARAITHGDYTRRAPLEGAPELRAVAHALNQMTQEVHATQQAQRDFLANVSHDLKTPLTSIQGYSQAIMDGTTPDPAHSAAIIHDEATRLVRMVDALTDLARLQAGNVPLRVERIDLSALVGAVLDRLAVIAQSKGIAFERGIAPGIGVQGDGDRLVQALTNLVSNALEHSPAGSTVRVELERAPGGGVLLRVIDHGVGIPPAEQARIFERFYQVDKSRGPRRGAGLGLAITREIVHAHGGRIEVYSAGENQGATFSVWLPGSS